MHVFQTEAPTLPDSRAPRLSLPALPPNRVSWHWFRLSGLHEMPPIIEAVLAAVSRAGFNAATAFAARLALEEAICNAIKHGHRDCTGKVVEVRYAVSPHQAIIEVQDEGAGFDTSTVPDPTALENLDHPGGRGLLLIRHYAAWVRHNRQGNCITFCLTASGPTAARTAPCPE